MVAQRHHTRLRDGTAGFGRSNFYSEPVPTVKLRNPTRYWHAGKVLFKKDW